MYQNTGIEIFRKIVYTDGMEVEELEKAKNIKSENPSAPTVSGGGGHPIII